jgi:hypothetical protein
MDLFSVLFFNSISKYRPGVVKLKIVSSWMRSKKATIREPYLYPNFSRELQMNLSRSLSVEALAVHHSGLYNLRYISFLLLLTLGDSFLGDCGRKYMPGFKQVRWQTLFSPANSSSAYTIFSVLRKKIENCSSRISKRSRIKPWQSHSRFRVIFHNDT